MAVESLSILCSSAIYLQSITDSQDFRSWQLTSSPMPVCPGKPRSRNACQGNAATKSMLNKLFMFGLSAVYGREENSLLSRLMTG